MMIVVVVMELVVSGDMIVVESFFGNDGCGPSLAVVIKSGYTVFAGH